MIDPRQLVIDLLSQQSERDKQISIGASNLSNPCSRCLADDMIGVRQPRGKYYLGAVIGSALHAHLEAAASSDPNLLTEFKVEIGHIEGYGTVKSTTDLFVQDEGLSVDFKTTSKKKLVLLKQAFTTPADDYDTDALLAARMTAKRYTAQLLLYGMGLENAGYEVSGVVPVFIARDATSDGPDSVWAPPVVPYRREATERVFDRGVRLWEYIQGGGDVETLAQHPSCYHCSVVRVDKD